MTVHICRENLLTIEASTEEVPDEMSVKNVVGKTLKEYGIDGWSSMEISQFSDSGKCLILAIPIKVYIPGILAAIADELA